MCGISGLLAWNAPGPIDELAKLATTMADSQRHRGPDGDGLWTDAERGVALSHRRLAVVGLGDEGAQPMVSRSGRWIVTYNGEIYNAPELARRLAAEGRRLRGSSDTEVLVEAIDAWGVDATLEAINGMFAFGAWDREQRRLVLARDRLGEKPLCYGVIGGRFAFASELQALRCLPGADASLDPDAVALFLRFKYVPAPFTIHKTMAKLLPGHVLEIDATSRTIGEPRVYWSLFDVAEAGAADPLPDTPETLDELDHLLGEAVRMRLRSDVPIGAFLSGGIDSTLVTTLAAEASSTPLRTFTIASDDPDHDESAAARQIAERLGTDHTELTVTADDALATVHELAGIHDEPFADSSQLPTLLVSRLAREHVTVVLSGDGGDEIFGGYNRHVWLPKVWDRVQRVPAPVRRAAAKGLAAPSPVVWDRLAHLVPESRRPRLVGLKVEKLASVLGSVDATAAYGRLVSHWNDPSSLVHGATEPTTITHDRSRWPDLPSLAEQMMAVDAVSYLPDDVLVKVDRASMSTSLEARVPLLDHKVAEFAARLPLEMRIRDGEGKWALRQLLVRRHPADLVNRPKSGFGVPIAQWLRGPLRPWASSQLNGSPLSGLGGQAEVIEVWKKHLEVRRDGAYELWDVVQLSAWTSVLNSQEGLCALSGSKD